jgi:hypothetical protein
MFRCWPRRGGPGEIRVARSKNSKSMSGYYTCTWCVVVDCRVFGFVWMFVCVIDRYIDRCIYIYIYICCAEGRQLLCVECGGSPMDGVSEGGGKEVSFCPVWLCG